MLSVSEVLLKCDMAETYHIHVLDWYDPPFPISYLADLAAGLNLDSRIKRRITKTNLSTNEALQALILDKLTTLVWQNTKDGHKGRRHPPSVFRKLEGLDKTEKDELEVFTTEEAYMKWRKAKMRKK